MNSEKELYTKIINSLNSDLARSKKKILWALFSSIFIIGSFYKLVFTGLFLIGATLIAGLTGSFGFAITFLFLAGILGSPLWYLIFQIARYRQTNNYLKSVKEVNHLIKNTFKTREDIENILNLSEKTKDALKKVLSLGLDKKKSSSKNTRIYYENQVLFFYLVLSNLRSDIQSHFSEKQKLLESTRSEVSEHIKGTDELNKISELQLTRLDNQIKQFEELQKMLVKV